jgi:NADPH-dependent curcumin reductase CurA
VSNVMNQQIVLAQSPSGRVTLSDFALVTTEVPFRAADQVLLRNILVSVAPHQRAVMQEPTFRPRLVAGEVIPSSVIAEVVAGPPDGPAPGTVIAGTAGWEEYSAVRAATVRPILAGRPLVRQLSLFGLNGLTAYFGMLQVGCVRPGETVVVSGAAGGVGHLAGQVARIAGAHVVGITGSAEKNLILEKKLGYTHTVSRRSAAFPDDLRAACADGVDVYFDTAGGPILDVVLPLMATHGRIVCCGETSQYDTDQTSLPSPRGFSKSVITKSLRIEGFLVMDFSPQWGDALTRLRDWEESGQLAVIEDVRDGLDAAPAALVAMMAGKSVGQLVVRIRQEAGLQQKRETMFETL